MVCLTNNTIEEWLSDRRAFCYDFMRYSFEWHHAVGADLQILSDEIEEAHVVWTSTVHEWQTQRFKQEANSLSYTKILSILLWALSQRAFVGEMKEYVPFRRSAPEFDGSEGTKIALRDDLLGAPEAVSALQFCLSVLNFYESERLDRKTPFVFKLTEASRHDLLMVLTSGRADPVGIYVAIDALYARD